MNFVLPQTVLQHLGSQDWFVAMMRLGGKVHRAVANRTTVECTLGDGHYFVKQHRAVGSWEIIKNLLQGRRPIVDATTEWRAIAALRAVGVNTLNAVGYGCEAGFIHQRQSFLITRALEHSQSLEQFCQTWPQRPPAVALKRHLVAQVADIVKALHSIPMVHRDCYLCHFLLPLNCNTQATSHYPQLTLIDLHRAISRQRLTQRWRIKDLAALYFSSRGIGLTSRDEWRFLQRYFAQPRLRTLLTQQRRLLLRLQAKTQALTVKYHRKFRRQAEATLGMPLVPVQRLAVECDQRAWPLAVLLGDDTEPVQCLQMLHRSADQRLVVQARWRGREVVAKFFLHPSRAGRQLRRERLGRVTLAAAGVALPKCLYDGKCYQGGGHALLFALN